MDHPHRPLAGAPSDARAPALYLGTSSFTERSWAIWNGGKPTLAGYARWIGSLCAGLPGAHPFVEVDSTYYGLPRRATVEAWAEVCRDTGLVLAAKAPEAVTHGALPGGDVAGARGQLQAMAEALSPLGDRLGPLLLQFGYGFRHPGHADTLLAALDALPPGPRWVVEVRHRSWLRDDVYEAFTARGVPLALVDHAWLQGQKTPRWLRATGPFRYVRLLGDRKGIEARIVAENRGDPPPTPFDRPGAVSTGEARAHLRFDRLAEPRDADLDLWVDLAREGFPAGPPTFLAVNNHYEGCAILTLQRIAERLSGGRGTAPAPP